MGGFENYIIIFVLALILFGPKKLPELARQLGKLMGEFRKASNEFKMQMEEELRVTERAEQEKKVAALEAAAPPPVIPSEGDAHLAEPVPVIDPVEVPAIATSGELTMHPPETGLPVAQSAESVQSAEPAQSEAAPRDAVNALADSVPAATAHIPEGQITHG
jgi:sec-independent protein translocase protein TatB